MADEIHIVIPDTDETVDVVIPDTETNTEIETEEPINNVDIGSTGDKYYSDLAKDWAVKMSGKVLGEDYSSKYYAQQAKEAAEKSLDMVEGSNSIQVTKTESKIIISSKTYIHTQAVAANEWTITHNLNKRPSVTAVDTNGFAWHPPIKYIDDNTCIAYFLGAMTGEAYCN